MSPEARPRLSAPQKALLAEIDEAGVLYVRYYGPYGRTVQALKRRGLIYEKEPDHSRLRMDGWAVVGS